MSRTDELLNQGARERGGGGGAPFVKWPEEGHGWVEGRVVGFWTGDYGDVATVRLTAFSDGLHAEGKDDEGQKYQADLEREMEVNVGLNSAALQGTIREEDQGKVMHIAFEGWDTSKRSGRRFRQFRVLELPQERPSVGEVRESRPIYPENPALVGGGPGAPGEEGPPIDDYEDDELPF